MASRTDIIPDVAIPSALVGTLYPTDAPADKCLAPQPTRLGPAIVYVVETRGAAGRDAYGHAPDAVAIANAAIASGVHAAPIYYNWEHHALMKQLLLAPEVLGVVLRAGELPAFSQRKLGELLNDLRLAGKQVGNELHEVVQLSASDGPPLHEEEGRLRRALELLETEMGAKHVDTLVAISNLATLLTEQSRLDEAEPLLRRVLEAREEQLGATHHDTLASASSLGGLLHAQGRLDDAEPLLRRAVAADEGQPGASDETTLQSMGELGMLLLSRGKLDQAEPLLRRALEGKEQLLGAANPSTLASSSALGALLLRQRGKLEEAEALLLRARDGQAERLGAEHARTLTTVHRLAELRQVQGRWADAEALYRQALEGREQQLGSAHADTRESATRLAALLQLQVQLDEGAEL